MSDYATQADARYERTIERVKAMNDKHEERIIVSCLRCGMGIDISTLDGPIFHSERYGHDAEWDEDEIADPEGEGY